jgi:hypothetical protein
MAAVRDTLSRIGGGGGAGLGAAGAVVVAGAVARGEPAVPQAASVAMHIADIVLASTWPTVLTPAWLQAPPERRLSG